MNYTELNFNFTEVTQLAQQPFERLTCEATFQDYLNASADNLNFYAILLFVSYSIYMFGSQYCLEKKILTKDKYIKAHRWANNVFTTTAIIYCLYAFLLA